MYNFLKAFLVLMKQGFVDRFGRNPRRLQLLFLSDAEKSCEQIPKPGEGQTGNVSKNFKIMFSF